MNDGVHKIGWSNGDVRAMRGSREFYLNNIAVTFGLLIQPHVLQNLREGTKRTFQNTGFSPRMLFCLPKPNLGYRNPRERKRISKSAVVEYNLGVKQLLSIPYLRDEHGNITPRQLYLDEEAYELSLQFAEEIELELRDGGRLQYLREFGGKLIAQSLRIAAIRQISSCIMIPGESTANLSALSGKSLPSHLRMISAESMASAIELCRKLISHTEAVMDLMGGDLSMTDAEAVCKWIRESVQQDEKGAYFFKQNDLNRSPRFNKSGIRRVLKALEVLQEHRMISPQCRLKKEKTKATLVYYVNPQLFADREKLNSTVAG